jgi:hypothetical protein
MFLQDVRKYEDRIAFARSFKSARNVKVLSG